MALKAAPATTSSTTMLTISSRSEKPSEQRDCLEDIPSLSLLVVAFHGNQRGGGRRPWPLRAGSIYNDSNRLQIPRSVGRNAPLTRVQSACDAQVAVHVQVIHVVKNGSAPRRATHGCIAGHDAAQPGSTGGR